MNGCDKEYLKKAIRNLVECYENGLATLQQIEMNYNDSMNVEFIAKHCKTIRSHERLINLHGSILEECVSMASESSNCSNSAGDESASALKDHESLDGTAHVPMEVCPFRLYDNVYTTPTSPDHEEFEEKFDTSSNGFYTEEQVDLVDQHVRFNGSVTVINYSKLIDEPQQVPATSEQLLPTTSEQLLPSTSEQQLPSTSTLNPIPKAKKTLFGNALLKHKKLNKLNNLKKKKN